MGGSSDATIPYSYLAISSDRIYYVLGPFIPSANQKERLISGAAKIPVIAPLQTKAVASVSAGRSLIPSLSTAHGRSSNNEGLRCDAIHEDDGIEKLPMAPK